MEPFIAEATWYLRNDQLHKLFNVMIKSQMISYIEFIPENKIDSKIKKGKIVGNGRIISHTIEYTQNDRTIRAVLIFQRSEEYIKEILVDEVFINSVFNITCYIFIILVVRFFIYYDILRHLQHINDYISNSFQAGRDLRSIETLSLNRTRRDDEIQKIVDTLNNVKQFKISTKDAIYDLLRTMATDINQMKTMILPKGMSTSKSVVNIGRDLAGNNIKKGQKPK